MDKYYLINDGTNKNYVKCSLMFNQQRKEAYCWTHTIKKDGVFETYLLFDGKDRRIHLLDYSRKTKKVEEAARTRFCELADRYALEFASINKLDIKL